MRVKLEQVCNRGSSNLSQKEVVSMEGAYPIYGASGQIGTADFYHQDKPYVAVVKDGAGIGRTMLLPACSSVIGTLQYLLPKENILPDYLCYAVQHMKLAKYFSGSTIPHIYFRDYKNEEFKLETIERQKEIVSSLNRLQRVISHRRAQLAKLDELVKCRFVEMFGDPVVNDKGWPMVRLGSIADIRIGPFGSLLHKEDYQSGKHALVNPSHIAEGKIKVDTTLSVSNDKYNELSAYWLNPGDIVMGRRGEMGRCAVVEYDGLICGTGSLIIRTHGQMKPYFLQNILSRPDYKKIIEGKAVGVTMMNLNVPIVSSLEVPLLPHEQQIKFLKFSRRIDKLRFGEIKMGIEGKDWGKSIDGKRERW